MKNIFIRYAALFAVLALALTGCPNPFISQEDAAAGLRITVANNNMRTLLPNTDFTKYTLHLEHASAQSQDVTLENGETSKTFTGLANGNWTVTAVGYVTIDGTEYAAAEGTVQVNVTSGAFQGVTIPISASMDGDNGFFSYAVSFPPGKVGDAEMRFEKFNGGYYDYIDLMTNPEDTISLAPGYYLMRIRLYADYGTATRTEVVHIYSNMETSAVYNFTEDDFTPTITLSGTVNVTVNGQPADFVAIGAFFDADYDNFTGAYNYVDLDDGTWAIRLPPFSADTTLYFALQIQGGGASSMKFTDVTATVKDQDISGIDLGNIGFSTITLSGTATVTLNGDDPGWSYVYVYADAQFQNYVGDGEIDLNGTDWSINIPSFDTDTLLYFTVEAGGNGSDGEKDTGVTRTVRAANVSGIDLGTIDIQDITLSGTINVTVDGQEPDQARLIVYEDRGNYMNWIGECYIDLASNTWSLMLSSSARDRVLRFEVEAHSPGSWSGQRKELSESVIAKDQDKSNINLGTVNFTTVTLSGTVAITIDGEPYDGWVQIIARNTNGYVFNTQANLYDDDTWSVTIVPFAADTTLRFLVGFNTPWGWVERETSVTRTVKDQSIDDIAIVYDFPLPSLITLGGTITATVNETVPQDNVYVRAYNDNIGTVFQTLVDLQNNTWSRELLSFSSNTRLYFEVQFYINGEWFSKNTDISVIVRDQSNTNINLGAVNFNYITQSIDAQIWRVGGTVTLSAPTIGQPVTAQGWQISSNGNSGWTNFIPPSTADMSYNGKYLRYYAITGDGEVLYSNTVRILVLSATEQAVIIDMWDSYGDGWNGDGSLRITVNGVQIATNVKVSSGYTNTHAFSVNTGDTVELYWVNEGSWKEENSFIAYYADTPPDPAFTADNNGSWYGANALVYWLRNTMDNISNGELLGTFTVP